jgi:methyltransferase-like protein/16S rRNA G527 N7-methylase RsmG
MNSYDQLEYKSLPFLQSTPAHLFTLAKIFGHSAPDFKSARVLEIGCASGGNVIPLAYQFPNAIFYGFDYSEKQIIKGQQLIKSLELKNIQLEQVDLRQFDLNQDKFDYIIAHGVFSWVSTELQEQLFNVCNHLLSDTGLAYISYNTYPGWNQLNSIREMMLYHTRHIDDPLEKIHASRHIFEVIQEQSLKDTPYSNFLNQEAIKISKAENYYLYHEHLEQDNHPIYFHDFMKMAHQHQLSYLCDANLQTILKDHQVSNKIKNQLSQFKDPVEKEQFVDFLVNRRFRSSILIKSHHQHNPKFELKDLNGFYFTSTFKTKSNIDPSQLLDTKPITFYKHNLELTSKHPISKCLIYLLQQQYQKPIALNDLTQKVANLTKQPPEAIQNYFYHSFNLQALILDGAIIPFSFNPNTSITITEYPIASKVARVLAEYGNEVTNLYHTSVKLNDFDCELLKLLDGSKTFNQLLEHVAQKFINTQTEIDISKISLSHRLKTSLSKFAQNGLLEEISHT